MAYLKKLMDNNVRNIEMESIAFAAMTHHAGIRSAILCVTVVNRINGDQVA